MKTFLYLLIALAALPLHAQHEVFSRKTGFLALKDKINAYIFDSKTHRLVVRDELDMSKPKYGSLDKAMRQSPCVAGINGSFFSDNPAGTPLGLVVQDGKTIGNLASGSYTVSGIVYDNGGNIYISRSFTFEKLKNKPRLYSAIQGGPFLVENGKAIAGLDDVKSTYRSFIATDGNGKWCIATTSPLTLKQLAAWLAQKGSMGGFTVKTALNMDGGSSSAFWCHTTSTYFPSMKKVRNYVGAAPRQQ